MQEFIIPKQDCFEVTVESANFSETFQAKYLINSAGLYSDELARMVNPESPYEIIPVRGEYACFYKLRKELSTGMNVYPVPLGNFVENGELAEVSFKEFQSLLEQKKIHKNLGIHLTPTLEFSENLSHIGDTVILGPTSTVNITKEDYSNFYDEDYYLRNTKEFFPNLKKEDIKLHQTGIRATLKNNYDFVIEKDKKYPNCINLLGINSPGLTASLAIAKQVVTETFINKP
ncbi:FAD-dependent oxidoreductase [archaeon]|nr:FAD-dependent oxidoreductase [archaeon]